ncbi:hypothetical protein CL176_08720 [Suicoccus acidiformans]|uniref:Peptidase M20 n=1 Tax=Suicoccus acidiformans TaxID=2036206 RepID=A0A347WLW8_9LACT|nr:M20/M25/M40 family metallo-hydrolase [Suicoccus acidiformans]AXY26075.1 hypothetical protein CL176_08720 [Suicoccus acidiformans]
MQVDYQDYVEANYADMLQDVLNLVRIPSVKQADAGAYLFGQAIHEVLNEFERLCHRLGMHQIHREDDYYAWVEIGNPTLPLVGIIGHVDIVDYDATTWAFNPLGEVTADTIYGRGISDDKGPVVMCLYAMKYVQDHNIPLRIRLIVGADEESDFHCAQKYLANQEEMPAYGLVPDAKFPLVLAEESIWNLSFRLTLADLGYPDAEGLSGGTDTNIIPDTAEIVQAGERQIFKGEAAHAGNYQGKQNAIMELFKAKKGATGSFLDRLVPYQADVAYEIPFANEAIVVKPTKLEMTNADSVLLTLDIRVTESLDIYQAKHELLKTFRLQESHITRENIAQGYRYSQDHPLIQKLLEVYQDALSNLPVSRPLSEPLAIAGTTYAKYFPNCISFGPGFPGEHSHAHRADERILIQSFKDAAYIYAQAICAFVDFEL